MSDAREGERVNHPQHYGGDTTYEVIKVLEAWGLGFHLGNAVKYIARAGKKPGSDAAEDLRKALWYLERYLGQAERADAVHHDPAEKPLRRKREPREGFTWEDVRRLRSVARDAEAVRRMPGAVEKRWAESLADFIESRLQPKQR